MSANLTRPTGRAAVCTTAVVLALIGALAGCGSGDSDRVSTTTSRPASTASTTPNTTSTETTATTGSTTPTSPATTPSTPTTSTSTSSAEDGGVSPGDPAAPDDGGAEPGDDGTTGGSSTGESDPTPQCKAGTGPGHPDKPQCEPLDGPDSRDEG